MNYPQEQIKPYRSEGKKTKQIEQMFDHIAPTYDKLNHTLSWNIDRCWRKRAIRCLTPSHPRSILDVATGTGDFAIQACRILQPKELIGVDISEKMMRVARTKVRAAGFERCISFRKEDVAALSFPSNRFDAVIVAFGVRNFENLDAGLQEMHRVLRENGRMIILELGTPQCFPMKQLYKLYSESVIPLLGRLFSKDGKAYRYLPDSVKAFPQGEKMIGIMHKAGFKDATWKRLTGGLCALYIATK